MELLQIKQLGQHIISKINNSSIILGLYKIDKAFALENMKKEARGLPKTFWMRSNSGEKMLILKQLRVKIPTDINPPLPHDLIVDCDCNQNKIQGNSKDH